MNKQSLKSGTLNTQRNSDTSGSQTLIHVTNRHVRCFKSSRLAEKDNFSSFPQKMETTSASQIAHNKSSNITTEKKQFGKKRQHCVENKAIIHCQNILTDQINTLRRENSQSVIVDLTKSKTSDHHRKGSSSALMYNGSATSYQYMPSDQIGMSTYRLQSNVKKSFDRRTPKEQIYSPPTTVLRNTRRLKSNHQLVTEKAFKVLQSINSSTKENYYTNQGITQDQQIINHFNCHGQTNSHHGTFDGPSTSMTVDNRSGTHHQMKLRDNSTTLRKYQKSQKVLGSTQIVHFKQLEAESGTKYNPSPIRRFNEEELQTIEQLRQKIDDQYLAVPSAENHILLQSVLEYQQKILVQTPHLSPGYRSTAKPQILDYQQSQSNHNSRKLQQLSECREHDDEVMASSPFKTPKSGSSSMRPSLKILQSRDQCNEEEDYENIKSSQSLSKQMQVLREKGISEHNSNRFYIPDNQFNLISSLLPTKQEERYSVLSHQAIQRLVSSPESKQQSTQGRLSIGESPNYTSRCLNMTPWRRFLLCCAASSNSNQPTQLQDHLNSAKCIKQQPYLPIQHSKVSRNRPPLIKKLSSYNNTTIDDFSDVDEHPLAHVPVLNPLVQTNGIVQPGSKILAEGYNWSSIQKRIVHDVITKPHQIQQITKEQQQCVVIDLVDTSQDELNDYLEENGAENIRDDEEINPAGRSKEQVQVEEEEESEEYDPGNEHYQNVISALKVIKQTLREPTREEIEEYLIELPQPDAPHKTKTIIFDMDETLIHCIDDPSLCKPDVIIPILFPEEDEPQDVGFNIRPFIKECLEAANLHFQVGVFTASQKAYADPILDYIDPERKYFQFRLYRDHCIKLSDLTYVKDLRIFSQRSLNDLILVDNSVYSFAFQIENGVPIIPFYNDPRDDELKHLMTYFECVAQVEDVREYNRRAFNLEELALKAMEDEEDDEDDSTPMDSSEEGGSNQLE